MQKAHSEMCVSVDCKQLKITEIKIMIRRALRHCRRRYCSLGEGKRCPWDPTKEILAMRAPSS